MSITVAIKILFLAVVFVATSGTVFSDWGRKHSALVLAASVVALIGSFYVMRDLYNDLKREAADEAISTLSRRDRRASDELENRSSAGRDQASGNKSGAEREGADSAGPFTRLDPSRGAKPLTQAELTFLQSVTRPMPDLSFKECADCPEMVVVPPGEFLMGSPQGEEGREENEDDTPNAGGNQVQVRIRKPFAAGRFEVTFMEWDACVDDGGCRHKPKAIWGRGRQPAIQVSWNDITQEYLPWLNRKVSGKAEGPYRLLSEAEWEYAARAGTSTRYAFGDNITNSQAQFADGSRKGTGRTVEVGSFRPNAFGLYDMHGNVMEWCEGCWNANYDNKSQNLNGAAWTTENCAIHVLRGGSWSDNARSLRSAQRNGDFATIRHIFSGFRVARTLIP